MKELREKHTPLEWKQIFESEAFQKECLYNGKDLGCNYTKEKTTFKIWAPSAKSVSLNLYKTGSDEEEAANLLSQVTMKEGKCGVWQAEIEEDLNGIYYTYMVYADGKQRETADIYGKASGVNGQRSMVINLENTNPEGWDRDKEFKANVCTPVIYEVHVKDFSSDFNSGVQPDYRGKFLAFTEEETYVGNKKNPTCLSYLKELGVTHVHLLPVYDYASVDESRKDNDQFNWGYDPQNYNVPEGSYSTDPYHGEVRIKEMKQMIQALHKAGIAVIMDVVYNHTFNTDSWFQYTVPYYYYRIDEDGSFSDGSMCGNDTASEHEMYRKYMIDSVCYWAEEYHIDGFRFDLMGLHDTQTMNDIRTALNGLPKGEQILMYGEPWKGDYTSIQKGFKLADKENIQELENGIAVFCDTIRDSIKGSVFEADEPGFVNGDITIEEKIKSSICGCCDGADEEFLPNNPGQIISYVSAHDNFTLWDKLVYTLRDTKAFTKMDKELIQRNKMAAGIYFTCLGIPFFQAGEEGARTKQGIENSYKTSSAINQIDWLRIYEYWDLVEYYKGLIDIRKHFSAFYNKSNNVLKQISFVDSKEEAVIAFCFKGNQSEHDKWKELYIIYNGNENKIVIDIPEGTWQLLSDGKKMNENEFVTNNIIVNQYSVTILGK